MQNRVRYTKREFSNFGWNLASSDLVTSVHQDAEVKQYPIHLDSPAISGGSYSKRCFDIFFAVSAILFLLPLFFLLAALIKMLDRGPIFYRHQRIGRNGALFSCLKFRTMVKDADTILKRHISLNAEAAREWEQTRKLKNDPRITRLGTILRQTSLDELPQLFNILRGEMSFVGPRPIVVAEIPKYGVHIGVYLRVRPGLTGAWQVSGRNDVSYESRVALDRDYVENWNFLRDLIIIVKTFRVVITSRGCY
jgi:exopolysaccharide production protein ExoY